jgi:annexin A7/11
MKDIMETVVFAMVSPSEYFAKRVNKAIKGVSTDDKTLIRVLVSRSELDLKYIKHFYKKKINIDIIEEIKSDCSDDYEDLLVELAIRA